MMDMKVRGQVRETAFRQIMELLKLAGNGNSVTEIVEEYLAAFAEAWEEVKKEMET